jgi:hypothetical protein
MLQQPHERAKGPLAPTARPLVPNVSAWCSLPRPLRQRRLNLSIDEIIEVVMSERFTPHQCPYCELKFMYANEVKDHVINDHPSHADSFAMVEVHELPQQ